MYRVANGTFRGCILADDPGLGKTLQALALIEALIWSRQAARVLVVCRYCDVSFPGDGRGWRGRTLGRGIRPAFNPLLNGGLGETPLAAGRPGAARAPTGG